MTNTGEHNDLPRPTVQAAMQLAAAVHDYDSTSVASILTRLPRHELHAVCVALGAMVDVDSTPRELSEWNDGAEVEQPQAAPLAPHGTHASFNRHKGRGEQPCAECWEGERTYQRLRGRRRRLALATSEAAS